jgi:hypothetical protein
MRSVLSVSRRCTGVHRTRPAARGRRGRRKAWRLACSVPLAIGATALSGAIQIDGIFNEDAWAKARSSTSSSSATKEGVPATHHTEVRVLFDATALYVACRADEPGTFEDPRLLTRRDDGSPSDWIRVFVDSYHDRRTAFEFAVNAAGSAGSLLVHDTNNDGGWDAGTSR